MWIPKFSKLENVIVIYQDRKKKTLMKLDAPFLVNFFYMIFMHFLFISESDDIKQICNSQKGIVFYQ